MSSALVGSRDSNTREITVLTLVVPEIKRQGLLQLNPSVYIPGQSTENNIQSRLLYPNYGFIASINSGVNSNYNAGQFEIEKRLGHGLAFQTNFTWSRALNDYGPNGQPGIFGVYGINTCGCGRSLDYGPDAGDDNKVFRFSGNYAFPRVPLKGSWIRRSTDGT
jgi:hypothetical protein